MKLRTEDGQGPCPTAPGMPAPGTHGAMQSVHAPGFRHLLTPQQRRWTLTIKYRGNHVALDQESEPARQAEYGGGAGDRPRHACRYRAEPRCGGEAVRPQARSMG